MQTRTVELSDGTKVEVRELRAAQVYTVLVAAYEASEGKDAFARETLETLALSAPDSPLKIPTHTMAECCDLDVAAVNALYQSDVLTLQEGVLAINPFFTAVHGRLAAMIQASTQSAPL